MLLPKIRAALKQEAGSSKPRVLFVHLMGSHPTFCTRLSGRPAAFDVGDSAMDCYLTTYRMMDSFVERTVDLLKANAGGSWSLVYFADHGLSMEKKPGTDSGKELEHGYDHRQNYEVPFFRISSDSHGHQVNPAYRTGFRMLEGLADWMGIRVSNENIRHAPEFWSEGSDTKIRVFGDRQYNEPRDPIQKQVRKEPERRDSLRLFGIQTNTRGFTPVSPSPLRASYSFPLPSSGRRSRYRKATASGSQA